MVGVVTGDQSKLVRASTDPGLDRLVAEAMVSRAPLGPALLVPRGAVGGHLLGLDLPRAEAVTTSGWGDHVGVYLICDEYVPAYLAQDGRSCVPELWARMLLQSRTQEELLCSLASALYVAGAPGDDGRQLRRDWSEHVLSALDSSLAAGISAALRQPGADRVLLARQPLLQTLKLVLAHAPISISGDRRVDAATIVTLLSHYASRESHSPRPDEPLLGGYPESLAMSLVQNAYFNAEDDFGDTLARFRQLWTAYESRLQRYPPRAPLRQMLREATGMDLDDILTLGFALFSQSVKNTVRTAYPLDLASLGLPRDVVEAFLFRFSATAHEHAAALATRPGEWEFLPLEDRPVLSLGGTTASALDVRFLQARLTSGLYWLVHDHEKKTHGEQARRAWTQTFSELVELHVEDQLRRMAPPIIGGATSFFTEEDLAALGGSTSDAGIDFGSAVLLAEIVQHQITVPTRQLGDVRAFRRDMEMSVLKKAQQLNSTVDVLLREPMHPKSPLDRRPTKIFPIVVQGAPLPVTPVTVRYARDEATLRGYFKQPECTPLLIVNVSELEILEGLVVSGRANVVGVLEAWVATGATDSLRNHIISAYGGATLSRNPVVATALDDQFQIVIERLQDLA